MYYVFNKDGMCVCCCNYEPDADDIASRNEVALFDEKIYENISRLQLIEGVITEMPLPQPSTEEVNKGKANAVRGELQEIAVNAMMMNLAGNADLADDRNAYKSKLASVEDSVALYCVDVFPVWSGEGVDYKVNDRVNYNGVLYKVLTAHTSQEGWKPDVAPSLFVKVLVQEGEILDWAQPSAGNAYMKGDRVRYNDKVYESLIDNNVWSPDGYPAGWLEIVESEN